MLRPPLQGVFQDVYFAKYLFLIVGSLGLKRKVAELGLKRRGQLETPLQQLVETIKVFPLDYQLLSVGGPRPYTSGCHCSL